MKTLEELNQELDKPIPRSAVSERQGGGGRSLSYLQGHYVIDRLNKVFGPLNWASDIKSLEKLYEGKDGDKYYVSYGATVRLVVQGPDGKPTEHTDTGFGDGSDRHPGKPYELARKEAVTDALKRCAKNLGMSMGLALYDKDQPNVAEDSPVGEQKAVAPTAAPSPVVSRPSAVDVHADRGQGAPTNRQKLNENLARVARILNETGKQPFAATKQLMQDKYGSQTKEQLSDVQAEELYAALSKLAG